jgi:hypothetical protein
MKKILFTVTALALIGGACAPLVGKGKAPPPMAPSPIITKG